MSVQLRSRGGKALRDVLLIRLLSTRGRIRLFVRRKRPSVQFVGSLVGEIGEMPCAAVTCSNCRPVPQCSGGAAHRNGATRTNTQIRSNSCDLTTLDPVGSANRASHNHGYLIFDTLYGLDETFTAQPQMAEGHTVENDGTLWTIRLREGLRFHDGEPVLARDAAASIRRFRGSRCIREVANGGNRRTGPRQMIARCAFA